MFKHISGLSVTDLQAWATKGSRFTQRPNGSVRWVAARLSNRTRSYLKVPHRISRGAEKAAGCRSQSFSLMVWRERKMRKVCWEKAKGERRQMGSLWRTIRQPTKSKKLRSNPEYLQERQAVDSSQVRHGSGGQIVKLLEKRCVWVLTAGRFGWNLLSLLTEQTSRSEGKISKSIAKSYNLLNCS